jgi:hypothetical protein
MGQRRRVRTVCDKSALHPIADIEADIDLCCEGPISDIQLWPFGTIGAVNPLNRG